jgi:glycosyltransferase involved in cell wall biosynthesis
VVLLDNIRVGVGELNYASARAFQSVPVPGAVFVREPSISARRVGVLFPKFGEIAQAAELFVPTGRSVLYHSFNAIPLNRAPWVVTFECLLPRLWNSPRLGSFLLARAASGDCRRVIAMSENAKLHLVRRNQGDPSLPAVLKKTEVLHSSVEDDLEALDFRRRRPSSTPFHLVFVGNEFFRKGGTFVVEAYERLKASFPLRLTVVSSLLAFNDVCAVDKAAVTMWKKRLFDGGIELRQHLSRGEVRRLLATADVLLLPTLEDSYGYSMIEAMATGVAVVATSVEAIPEIVEDGKTGLLIELPLTEEKRILWSEDVGSRIVDQITLKLEGLLSDSDRMAEMGERGRERYDRLFRPDVLGARLREIYAMALDGFGA